LSHSKYYRLRPILHDALTLYDHIRHDFREDRNEAGGNAGRMNILEKAAKGHKLEFPFAELSPNDYRLTKGASYPMLAAFRNMVVTDSAGNATWQGGFKSVLRLWSEAGPELEEETYNATKEIGRMPDQLGKRKEGLIVNPNDTIRKQMLQYFYDRNACATSARGKNGSAMKISDVKRDLKGRYALTQQMVISNLTYLLDRGWVKKCEVEKTVNVPGGTIPSIVTWYEIAAPGIDKIEGGSQFEPKDRYAGIQVNATGTNVITLGDGNVVNAQFSKLREQLDDLKSQITSSAVLSENAKFEAAVDIESFKDQLAKESQDKTVLAPLWSSIDHVASVAGLVETAHNLWSVISPLL
jgi:hypothetical protein